MKSNLGHAQAAAGIGGVIKMVQAIRHGVLPRTLHVEEPSPHVDWSAGNVRLLTESLPWPRNGHPRRAGVSSFGISGTNAHLILEAPPEAGVRQPTAAPSITAWPVSAKTGRALQAQARRLADHLTAHPGAHPGEVALRLATRTHFPHRAVIIGTDRDRLLTTLQSLARGDVGPDVIQGVAKAHGRPAFLFTGQGSHHPGMGRELYDAYPVFADALDETIAHLDPHLDRPLKTVMFTGPTESLEQPRYAQAAVFALEVALYRLVGSFGVTPGYLLGHSVGALAAAHVAGVVSRPDACALVTARGPEVLREAADTARYGTPAIPIVSEHTGDLVTAEQLIRPGHWVDRLSRPVSPPTVLRTPRDHAVIGCLVLGPDVTLTGTDHLVVGALRAGQAESPTFLTALARLHTAGVHVDWTALHPDARPVDLPTYPFQRRRYWLTPGGSPAGR